MPLFLLFLLCSPRRGSRLRDPLVRVEYLLEIEGMRKEGEHKQQAPPELLEEVFELNESLDELREAKASGGDLAARITIIPLTGRICGKERAFLRTTHCTMGKAS